MLKLLVYKEVDKDVLYAIAEMLSHIGVPFEEICNLKEQRLRDPSNILLIPETARIDPKIEGKLPTYFSAIIYAGYSRKILPKKNVPNSTLSGSGFISALLEKFDNYKKELMKRNQEMTTEPIFVLPPFLKLVSGLLSSPESYDQEELSGQSREYLELNENNTDVNIKFRINLPVINIYEELLLETIKKISEEKSIPLVQKWFYPKNHEMALCLTHDIDVPSRVTLFDIFKAFSSCKLKQFITGILFALICEYSKISRKNKIKASFLWNFLQKLITVLMPYSPSWNLDGYFKAEDAFNAKSTYFMLVCPSEKTCQNCPVHPIFLKKLASFIAESNHEIALHSSYLSSIDFNQMIKEKQILENISKKKTFGVRQHRLMVSFPESWVNHEKTSFLYDTSLGYNQLVGFRVRICFPFEPWNFKEQRKISILEMPIIVQDKALFGENGGYSEKAMDNCKKIIDLVHNYNGVFTVLWHACVSKFSRTYLTSSYYNILQYASKYNAWLTNCISLTNWWKLRNAILIEPVKVYGSRLEFMVISPENYDGFSINLYIPKEPKNIKIFVDGNQLSNDQILMRGNNILFWFNLSKGSNKLIIESIH